jgi:hypothetical protein
MQNVQRGADFAWLASTRTPRRTNPHLRTWTSHQTQVLGLQYHTLQDVELNYHMVHKLLD